MEQTQCLSTTLRAFHSETTTARLTTPLIQTVIAD